MSLSTARAIAQWLGARTHADSPECVHTLVAALRTALEDPTGAPALVQSLLVEARSALPSVHALFKILWACGDRSPRVGDEMVFGINCRPMAIAPFVAAADQPWSGGLPLVVPVSHLLRVLPRHFVIAGPYVHFVADTAATLPASMQQAVRPDTGMLKIYFRKAGVTAALGNENEFLLKAPRLSESALGVLLAEHGWQSATPCAYFGHCVARSMVPETDPFLRSLLDCLSGSLFETDGRFSAQAGAVGFLRETGPGPRCASRAVSRTLQPLLPRHIKTTADLANPECLQSLADCKNREELDGLCAVLVPESARPWVAVEWDKPEDRGIVFILQGVGQPALHHVWSCADKPPLCPDGRFFKEANVPGLEWTLRELAEDPDAVLVLVALLIHMACM